MAERSDDKQKKTEAHGYLCPAGGEMDVYRRDPAEKLNTIILLAGAGWKAQRRAVEAILQNEGFSSVSSASLPGVQIQRGHTLVLTDRAVWARAYGEKGFVCVGCGGEGDTFFDGAGLVLENPEAVDISYMEEYLCHMLGEAVQVAQTPRLILREISPDEVEGLCDISRQCESRFLMRPEEGDFFTPERLLAYVKQIYRLAGYGLWSVLLKREPPHGPVLIGCCGLSDVLWEDGTSRVELQYMLGEKYRRQGYGYEMCREALRLASERAACETVWLRLHPDNLPSVKLAEKLGFCRMENEDRHGAGAFTEIYFYSP